jgi:hypothetical protein
MAPPTRKRRRASSPTRPPTQPSPKRSRGRPRGGSKKKDTNITAATANTQRQRGRPKASRKTEDADDTNSVANPQACLDGLPNELIIMIMEKLAQTCSCDGCARRAGINAYHQLVQVNKHLSSLAEEFLYKSFKAYRGAFRGGQRSGEFLRTVIAKVRNLGLRSLSRRMGDRSFFLSRHKDLPVEAWAYSL